MKILINATVYSNERNGLGVYTSNVLRSLENSKTEFQVISFRAIATGFDSVVLKYGLLEKIISLGSVSIYRFIWNVLILPFYSKRYDLVYSVSPHGSPFIKNQIITVHDLIGLQDGVDWFQKNYYKFFLPRLLKSCQKVIAISEVTKSEILALTSIPQKQIKVIYNGADNMLGPSKDVLPRCDIGGKGFFLAVGAGYSHKNLEIVMDAFSWFKEYRFVIVHNGSKYAKRLLQKKKRENKSNVIFLESVSEQELSWLYSNSEACIYPTLHEGFGFPPFEAILHGTISIVSRIPCLEEIYPEGCVLFTDPNSVDYIRKAIQTVLEMSQSKRDVMLECGKVRLSQFKWEKFSKELTLLLEIECSRKQNGNNLNLSDL